MDRNLVNTMRNNYYVVQTDTKLYLYDEDFNMVEILMEDYKDVLMVEGALYRITSYNVCYTKLLRNLFSWAISLV